MIIHRCIIHIYLYGIQDHIYNDSINLIDLTWEPLLISGLLTLFPLSGATWLISRNLGTVYNQLREHDKAKVYFDAAAELVGQRDSNGELILDKEDP